MRYNRTIIMNARTFTTGVQESENLPVNPISHLVMTMRFLNVTDEATLAEVLTALDNIEVLWNGQAIFQMNGTDTFRLNMALFGQTPFLSNQVATDNAARWISLILPFSNKLYDPEQGLPATKKGTLQARLTRSASDAAIDGQTIILEAIEMMDAQPKKTLKCTTLTRTPTATGDLDVDIPREGELAGLLVFGTTVPTSTAFTKTINDMRLLVNNNEEYVTQGIWEGLRGEHSWRMGQEKGAVTADTAPNDDNHVFIDLDPRHDDSYLLNTEPLNDLKLRVNAGDTNALRVIPVRKVDAARFANAA
jgi:hypothetical protein